MITMAIAVDRVSFPIEGKGNVKIIFNNIEYWFSNVLYSPNLHRSLISGHPSHLVHFKHISLHIVGYQSSAKMTIQEKKNPQKSPYILCPTILLERKRKKRNYCK